MRYSGKLITGPSGFKRPILIAEPVAFIGLVLPQAIARARRAAPAPSFLSRAGFSGVAHFAAALTAPLPAFADTDVVPNASAAETASAMGTNNFLFWFFNIPPIG